MFAIFTKRVDKQHPFVSSQSPNVQAEEAAVPTTGKPPPRIRGYASSYLFASSY